MSGGFLPGGLFERIISKIVLWCQSTSRHSTFSYRNIVVHRNMAILNFGRQRFRVVSCPIINSIQVDIEGLNPMAIHHALSNIIDNAIAECFKSLTCFTAIVHSCAAGGNEQNKSMTTISEDVCHFAHELQSGTTEQQLLVIPMRHLWAAAIDRSPLMKAGARKLFDADEIQQCYGSWLRIPKPLDKYMVFISYRWMPFNSHCVSLIYDMFSNFTVGEYHEAIDVFLDKKLLQSGRRFDFDFVKALSQSSVLMPIVSVESLIKMSDPNISGVDNLLLEWVVSLELIKETVSADTKLKAIFPIAFGESTMCDNKVISDNLFASSTYKALPKVVPIATLELASTLLRSVRPGIVLSPGFMEQTIEGIVTSLMKYKGYLAWESPPERVIESLVVDCIEVLERLPVPKTVIKTKRVMKKMGQLPDNERVVTVEGISPSPQILTDVKSPDAKDEAAEGVLSRDHQIEQPIMEFLRLEKNISNQEGIDALLVEIGVYEDQDILDLDDLYIEKIIEFIKVARRKAFARLLTV